MVGGRIHSGAENYEDVVRGSLSVRLDLEQMAARAQRIDKRRIQNILEARGVTALYHFTPLDNLQNLRNYGILSRADLVENEVSFVPTDTLRIDGVNNASCLSLAFPNYKMFYQKRHELAGVAGWAVLKICPSVLWEEPCLFLPRNAAAMTPSLKASPGRFLGAPALSRVFDEPENIPRDEMGLSPDLPTNPQTEVLVLSSIESEKIESICVDDSRSIRHASSLLQGSRLADLLCIDDSVFSPRCDYPFWKH